MTPEENITTRETAEEKAELDAAFDAAEQFIVLAHEAGADVQTALCIALADDIAFARDETKIRRRVRGAAKDVLALALSMHADRREEASEAA